MGINEIPYVNPVAKGLKYHYSIQNTRRKYFMSYTDHFYSYQGNILQSGGCAKWESDSQTSHACLRKAGAHIFPNPTSPPLPEALHQLSIERMLCPLSWTLARLRQKRENAHIKDSSQKGLKKMSKKFPSLVQTSCSSSKVDSTIHQKQSISLLCSHSTWKKKK